jgi:type I restriction enzyme, S subunit
MTHQWPIVPLAKVIQQRKEFITINDLETYMRPRVQSHARGIVLRDEVPGAEIKTKQQQVCRAGEFLVAEIDAKVGGYGIVPQDLDGSLVSSHYFLFEIDGSQLDQGFLDYFIRTPAFYDQVAAQGSTNYAAIRANDVLGYEIPLPPLDEQRRLVARIEALAAKIEEARGLRRLAVEEAKAILVSARASIFEIELLTYPIVRLDDIADVQLGKMLSPKSKTGRNPRPYLRNANVQWDRFDLSQIFEMDFDEREIEKFTLMAGDLLVCEGGVIGRAAVWSNEIEGCLYQKALHRVRVNKDKTIPRFILNGLFWGSAAGKFSDLQTQTTIAHLPAIKLKSFEILCPPLEEQRRIVAYLDGLQGKVDALKQLQAQTQVELDALLPSVLDRAFKGELL